ncbi:peptidoglycan-binding domain-containing protein [Planktothrix mougeotii]|uniref:Peptidoglycan-binding protein n=1 Tax=Planktothrix mougeotii LEGE 06226 TaxID=1828728 RepID=A0ABR9U8F5_9CYAN|nr:peptidoglycan-binding domain-containing protein [Planktothrix mougeotii]MBE9142738.1 peptidoglycan-binding protein [Planktothrix mougeotii LEGE 06226]
MILKPGALGAHVREIQYQLERLGYNIGRFGMPFDEQLEATVKAFQEEMELPIDGIIGDATRLKIQEAVTAIENSTDVNQNSGYSAEHKLRPVPNELGDFLNGNWQQWRVICSKTLNARSGPGFNYSIDMTFPTNTVLMLHPEYRYPIKFDQVGKPWLVISYQGGAFFIRANQRFIEPVV